MGGSDHGAKSWYIGSLGWSYLASPSRGLPCLRHRPGRDELRRRPERSSSRSGCWWGSRPLLVWRVRSIDSTGTHADILEVPGTLPTAVPMCVGSSARTPSNRDGLALTHDASRDSADGRRHGVLRRRRRCSAKSELGPYQYREPCRLPGVRCVYRRRQPKSVRRRCSTATATACSAPPTRDNAADFTCGDPVTPQNNAGDTAIFACHHVVRRRYADPTGGVETPTRRQPGAHRHTAACAATAAATARCRSVI
jgi:hypothetical protein